MVYKVVSVECKEINDGLGIGYAELQFSGGKWGYDNLLKSHEEYADEWKDKLSKLTDITSLDYLDWNNAFGNYVANRVKNFIVTNDLEFKVQLIAFKGLPVFTNTSRHEFGSPAQLAALTGINVVADFTGINNSLGGNADYQHSVAATIWSDQQIELQLALLAVLRWREENNFNAEHTGATRNSIGGAVWMGQEA